LDVDLLECLPRFQERRPGLDGAELGQFLGPGIPLDDTGADSLGGQEPPVELLHAAEELAYPFVELGLRNVFVGLGDPDPLADLEEVRDGLKHGDVCERGVLIQHVRGDRPRGDSKDRAAAGSKDPTQRVTEVQIHGVPDDLREEVGPCCARRMTLALDVQGGELHELVVGENPLPWRRRVSGGSLPARGRPAWPGSGRPAAAPIRGGSQDRRDERRSGSL